MGGEKLFDIPVGHFRDYTNATGIEEGCRNNRGKSVKVGIFMGRCYKHFRQTKDKKVCSRGYCS
jgi:hypothetical protein